jgi:hypothetical protein
VALIDLSKLSPMTRQLVQDARYRAKLTSDLLKSDPSSPPSIHARDAIDAAVVEVLAAAGLPRGPINGPVVDQIGRGWYGRKTYDCTLLIDIRTLSLLPEADQADSTLRTWIHESLHARHPYAPGFDREWREHRGFEEGLVEGLTRFLVVESLTLRPVIASYHFYVAAYRTLADVLDIEVEQLWRTMWVYPAGDASAMLLPVGERILIKDGRAPLTPTQRARFVGLAVRHFSTDRTNDRPNEAVLETAWRSVIG